MPASPDALALATIHLLPKIGQTFFDDHPMLKRVIENGVDRRNSGGEYAAFDIVTEGPGNITQLVTGTEAYAYGRRNIVTQGRVYIPRSVYSFAVEGSTLARTNNDEMGIAKLLKMYPEHSMMDFKQKSVAQVLTGAGTVAGDGTRGLLTLNGTQTYSPDGTALTGAFQFAPKASQTDTVFNIVKEGGAGGAVGWYNQYGEVSSFATSGRKTMRAVYNACQIRAGSMGSPKLGLTDATSFNNFYESLDDQVRHQSVVKGENGPTSASGIMFHDLEIFEDPSMTDNLTAFTGITTDGVMYMLNTESFGILTVGEQSEFETKGFFEMRKPIKLEGRDAWGFEIICNWQLYCTNLKANGVLRGTAL